MLVYLLAFWLSQGAQARWASPKDVGAVLENYSIHYVVRKDGSYDQTYEEIWRIQTEEGKLHYSERELQYNPFSDKVEILKAETINGKEHTAVPKSAIEDRDKYESHDYDPIKVKSLLFPKVHIGSLVHLKYKITSSHPPIPGEWSLRFDILPGVLIQKMRLQIDSELKLTYDLHDPEHQVALKASAKHIEAWLKKPNPGAVVAEKDPYFHPDRFAHLIVSSQPNWASYYRTLTEEFQGVLAKPLPPDIEPHLKSWKKIKNPQDRLVKVLEWMSQSFRYFGDWRRIRGGFIPRSLQEIDNSRYGDCKDLATLLTAILRRLGFQADVSLVSRGANAWVKAPEEKIAYLGAFNHAIARVQKGDKVWWLDATNPVVSLKPYLDIAGKPTWVLSEASQKFDRIPPVEPQDYIYEHYLRYNFHHSKNVHVDVEAKYQKMAAFDLANSFLTSSVERTLYSLLNYYSEDQDIVSSQFLSTPKIGRQLHDLTVKMSYVTTSVSYKSSLGRFLPLGDGMLTGAFYETAHRESDLKLADMPLIQRTHRLLEGARLVGKPILCQIHSPWIGLERKVRQTPQGIEIEQTAQVKIPVVQKSEYHSKAFKLLQTKARQCFYRTGLVFQTK